MADSYIGYGDRGGGASGGVGLKEIAKSTALSPLNNNRWADTYLTFPASLSSNSYIAIGLYATLDASTGDTSTAGGFHLGWQFMRYSDILTLTGVTAGDTAASSGPNSGTYFASWDNGGTHLVVSLVQDENRGLFSTTHERLVIRTNILFYIVHQVGG